MEAAACQEEDCAARQRMRLTVSGAVQGVGFRPFVYRLATELGLGGVVRNTAAGVVIEVEGPPGAIETFAAELARRATFPARIERIAREELVPSGCSDFVIDDSNAEGSPSAQVLPDLAICNACHAELFDPGDRRYRYPFTTCMHCGPRYSVIEALPYDRERTAMRKFPMCPACEAEYRDPASRRFHAETNACHECGPRLALRSADGSLVAEGEDALSAATLALRSGRILALKGLGGFQLLVDARNEEAVARLRRRKRRPAKPFAVLVSSLEEAAELAQVTGQELDLLASSAAPIVLLRQRGESPLAPSVAPDNPDIGVMLPSTPLHALLAADLGFPVVATSGNCSGQPIASRDEEALAQLGGIAELFLTHDRPILHPVDDSVARLIAGEATVLRSARGYAPVRLTDNRQDEPVLALGGHMKASIGIGLAGRIVLGPHLGDLDDVETRAAHARCVHELTRLHGRVPKRIACDTHPDYHTTRMAEARGTPSRAPHHLAHVLSCVIDNGIEGPVMGLAWDGTGHGRDGTIWGGEFLQVDGETYRREAHFLPFRLPGGSAAVSEPRRSALGVLHEVFGETMWQFDLPPLAAWSASERPMLAVMLSKGVNAPRTSSVGRLFDAVASILGLRQYSSFEGEAAMAVEFAARTARPFELPEPILHPGSDGWQVDWRPMLGSLVHACARDERPAELARGFIQWLAEAALAVCRRSGAQQVVLTGGCFQNALLAERTAEGLWHAGYQPFLHRRVPPNDGGLAVGQAAYAARKMYEEMAPCA